MSRLLKLFLLGCSLGLPAQVPSWATALPQREGHVYAVGVVSLQGDEAEARMKAGQLARLELLLQLRTRAEASTVLRTSMARTWSEEVGPSSQSFGSYAVQASFQVQAMALPGLEVQEVRVDHAHGQVFALAVLDMDHAQALHRRDGADLGERMNAALAAPEPRSWGERIRQAREVRLLVDQYAAWEDTRALLMTASLFGEVTAPDPNQVRALQLSSLVAVSLVETMDLPAGLISSLHGWRTRRGLAGPSTSTLRLEPRTLMEWSRVMDLERVRGRWTIVLSTTEGDCLALWAFEAQAVGATRQEAMQNLNRTLVPRVQDALDLWFGFPSSTFSSKEAS